MSYQLGRLLVIQLAPVMLLVVLPIGDLLKLLLLLPLTAVNTLLSKDEEFR